MLVSKQGKRSGESGCSRNRHCCCTLKRFVGRLNRSRRREHTAGTSWTGQREKRKIEDYMMAAGNAGAGIVRDCRTSSWNALVVSARSGVDSHRERWSGCSVYTVMQCSDWLGDGHRSLAMYPCLYMGCIRLRDVGGYHKCYMLVLPRCRHNVLTVRHSLVGCHTDPDTTRSLGSGDCVRTDSIVDRCGSLP